MQYTNVCSPFLNPNSAFLLIIKVGGIGDRIELREHPNCGLSIAVLYVTYVLFPIDENLTTRGKA